MPVDVEAYMAGAIPALSRGGSWLPDQGPGNGTSLPPLQPQSAYGSSPISSYPQTPPAALRGMSGSPVIGGPLQFPKSPWVRPSASPASVHSARSRTMSQVDLAGSASTHGLKRESVLGPVKHNGWLKTGSEASDSVGGSIYQESIGPSASARVITPNHLPPSHLHRATPHAGDLWERQAGSPKPSSREPDYVHKNQPHPPTEVSVPITSPYRKISEQNILQPSPYRRVTELLPPSPSERSSSSRPCLARRHTHNPLHAPKPKKHQEEDLYRSAQLNNRLARLSLAGRDCHTPDPHSAPNSPTVLREASHSSRSRRHSSSNTSSSSSLPSETAHHKSHRHAERPRHLSSPHGAPLVPSPSSASPDRRPSAGSALDFTASGSRHVPFSPRPLPQSASNFGESYKSSPTSPRSRTSSVTGLPVKKPVGYISPMNNEEYDPYEAHPAAPVPDRTDRHVNSAGLNVSETSSSHQGPLSPAKKEYVPPGFAKPTREVPWNREGPAMKTHGIAWLREGDPHALPTAPKGPRWDVARPPRIDQTQNASWWESSGGRVNSYNVG